MPSYNDIVFDIMDLIYNRKEKFRMLNGRNPSKIHVYINHEIFYRIRSSPSCKFYTSLDNNDDMEIYGAKVFVVTSPQHSIEILME